MRYRVDMKFPKPPSITIYVEAQNEDQAKIRANREAIRATGGYAKKMFVRAEP